MTRDFSKSSLAASALRLAVTIATACLLPACALRSSWAEQPQRADQPAVLVAPSAATRAELAHAVSEGMNGAPVRLADDALTHDSRLFISRMQHRDSANLPLNGRSTEKPVAFDLVERGGACLLIQELTARHWRLRSAHCVRVASR